MQSDTGCIPCCWMLAACQTARELKIQKAAAVAATAGVAEDDNLALSENPGAPLAEHMSRAGASSSFMEMKAVPKKPRSASEGPQLPPLPPTPDDGGWKMEVKNGEEDKAAAALAKADRELVLAEAALKTAKDKAKAVLVAAAKVKAAGGNPDIMLIGVPAGAMAGQQMQVPAPSSALVCVLIPAGNWSAGGSFPLQLPPTEQPEGRVKAIVAAPGKKVDLARAQQAAAAKRVAKAQKVPLDLIRKEVADAAQVHFDRILDELLRGETPEPLRIREVPTVTAKLKAWEKESTWKVPQCRCQCSD